MMKILKNKFDLKNLDKYQKSLIDLVKKGIYYGEHSDGCDGFWRFPKDKISKQSKKIYKLKKNSDYHEIVCGGCGSTEGLSFLISTRNEELVPLNIDCRKCKLATSFHY